MGGFVKISYWFCIKGCFILIIHLFVHSATRSLPPPRSDDSSTRSFPPPGSLLPISYSSLGRSGVRVSISGNLLLPYLPPIARQTVVASLSMRNHFKNYISASCLFIFCNTGHRFRLHSADRLCPGARGMKHDRIRISVLFSPISVPWCRPTYIQPFSTILNG